MSRGHVGEVVLRGAAAAQDRRRARRPEAQVGGPAGVAVVEPDDPVAPLGERGAELVGQLCSCCPSPATRRTGGSPGVAELLVAQRDAAPDVDEPLLGVMPAPRSGVAAPTRRTRARGGARPPARLGAGALATPRECQRSSGAYVVQK